MTDLYFKIVHNTDQQERGRTLIRFDKTNKTPPFLSMMAGMFITKNFFNR